MAVIVSDNPIRRASHRQFQQVVIPFIGRFGHHEK